MQAAHATGVRWRVCLLWLATAAFSGALSDTACGGDVGVVELTHSLLDRRGNAVEEHHFEMNHTDSGVDLGLDLTANDDYVRRSIYHW